MVRRKRRLPFRYLEPAFFGGLLDDPVLFLRIRPLKRALLFDCGQIAHLAKRVVKPIDAVFITHAHMDHIMGVPTLVRHHHASPRPLDLYGPPGIADRVKHLLGGYDWNLTEPTWFTLRVHEIHPDRICHYSFPGPDGFVQRSEGAEPRSGREIWSCRYVSVEAELLDHKMPVLAFRINEKPQFSIDSGRLAQLGLRPGEWLRDLKTCAWKGHTGHEVVVPVQDAEAEPFLPGDPAALYAAIRKDQACASIGYLCDVGWTAENRAVCEDFLEGLTLLCCECTFLGSDMAKARASHHLCTTDVNELASCLLPQHLLPMHLSKSYLRHTVDLYQEIRLPVETALIRLPNHIVPQPLSVADVDKWLRQ
jgi:ribonuclease Z